MSMLQLRDLGSASGHGGDPVEFEVRRILSECIEHVAQRLPYAACGLFFDFDGFHPRRARCHVRRMRTPGYVPPLSLSVAGPFLDRHPDRRIYSYSQMTQLDPESPRRRLEQEQEPEWDDFVQMAFWDEGNLEAVFSITWTQQDGDLASHAIEACEHLYPEVEQELKRLRRFGREQESTAAVESFMEQLGEPIMLVGFDGRTLFANALAREACGRWNTALKADDRAMPDALVNGLQDIADTTTGMRSVGEDPMREACVLKHPREPSLSMHVSVVWKALGLRTQPFYTLRFLCQGASSGAAVEGQGGESEKARALRSLSPRERQVALLVAEGLRNEEIANRLVRSRRTIEFQIASIYRKLDLSGRVQLARLVA